MKQLYDCHIKDHDNKKYFFLIDKGRKSENELYLWVHSGFPDAKEISLKRWNNRRTLALDMTFRHFDSKK